MTKKHYDISHTSLRVASLRYRRHQHRRRALCEHAAAVTAISCAKENLPVEDETHTPEVELVPMTFTASYAETDDAETKVALENGATV